jgi:hypothetical protein
MRILAITQDFSRRNPGGWALACILNDLADRHDIMCIGGAPRPDELHASITYCRAFRIQHAGIFAGLITFHLSHFFIWLWLSYVRRKKFDVIQTIDAESLIGTVVTFQFCDAAFLELAKQYRLFNASTWRGRIGAMNELIIRKFRTVIQRRVCRSHRTRAIIAVSSQLAEHLTQHYQPAVTPVVITNPIP